MVLKSWRQGEREWEKKKKERKMGSCVSVHKSSQESAMKLGLSLEPKTDSLIIPPSPAKEKPAAANGDFALKSQSSSTFKDLGN